MTTMRTKVILLLVMLCVHAFTQVIYLNWSVDLFYDFSSFDTMHIKQCIQTVCIPGRIKTKCKKTITEYNEKQQILNQVTFNRKGKACERDTFVYDSLNNLIREVRYDSDGDYDEETFYIYNKQKKLIEIVEYNDEHEVEKKTSFTYDSTGYLIKRTGFESDGMVSGSVKYQSYDKMGNCTAYVKYGSSGEIDHVVRKQIEYY